MEVGGRGKRSEGRRVGGGGGGAAGGVEDAKIV